MSKGGFQAGKKTRDQTGSKKVKETRRNSERGSDPNLTQCCHLVDDLQLPHAACRHAEEVAYDLHHAAVLRTLITSCTAQEVGPDNGNMVSGRNTSQCRHRTLMKL